MFGQSNNKSLFGSSTTNSAFGQPNTSAFGVQQQTAGPFGAMGGQQPQQSLFGTTTTQPLFGSTNQSSLFGTTPNAGTANTFGSQPTTGAFAGSSSSLFGGNQQNNSLFGGNRFGGAATTSPFGATQMAPTTTNGTTIKFNPTAGTDTMMKNGVSQNINTRHQCITCMREYENKSLEELRLEDYTANRKGPQQSAGMFGTTSAVNTGTSLFGTTSPPNAFSSTANTGLFGQNKSTFGTMAPTTTPTSSGLFGSPAFNANNKPLFGTSTSFPSAQTPAPTTSMFGSVSTANPTLNNSFFSGTPNTNTAAVKPLFGGTTAQPQQSLFGPTSAQNTSLAQKPMFGTTTTSVPQFGSTNTTSLFNTGSGTNLFSGSQPTLFNSGTTSTNNTLAKPMFNFNTTSMPNSITGTGVTSTAGLFGTTSTTFGNAGSLFGNSNPTNQFSFGPTNTSFPATNTFQSNTGLQPMTGSTSSVSTEQLVTRFQTFPYGESPQLQIDLTLPSSATIRTKFTTDPKTLNQYKISAKTIDNRPLRYINNSPKVNTMLFDGLEEDNAAENKTAKDIFVPRRNFKKLVFRPKTVSSIADLNVSHNSPSGSTFLVTDRQQQSPVIKLDDSIAANNTVNEFNRVNQSMTKMADTSAKSRLNISSDEPIRGLTGDSLSSASASDTSGEREVTNSDQISVVNLKCGLTLTRSDYYTIPPLEELDNFYDMSSDTCVVPNFTVGRQGYGSIYWDSAIDVKGLNLDELVHIRRKEVIVYPDEELAPKRGEGLNRPAQITLDQVWPVDKTTHEVIKDRDRLRAMRWAEKIEAATNKLNASFKEYRPESGSWVFTVKHFSKYGLTDEDDEEVAVQTDETRPVTGKPVGADSQMVGPYKTLAKGVDYQHLSDSSNLIDMNLDISPKMMVTAADSAMNFLFDEEGDDMLDDHMSLPMATKVTEYDKMRSTLFDEYDEVLTKKTKTFAAISPPKEIIKSLPSIMPPIVRPITLKKRDLHFEADGFAAHNKLICDISSVCVSTAPKLTFFNGSRNFLFIQGSNVLVCEFNLIDLNASVVDRFEEQFRTNSNLLRANTQTIPPFIETRDYSKNSHNSQSLEQLVEALYGPLSEVTPYACHQQRMDRILNWLFSINKKFAIPKQSYSKIIHFLSTEELEVAVEEALNHNNPRLAQLLAFGNNIDKKSMLDQLDSWKTSNADVFIEKDLIKIYVLMSGLISWKLSDQTTVDVLEGLEWTQQLALILLYKNPNEPEHNELGLNLLKDAISNLKVEPKQVEYHLLALDGPWISLCFAPSPLDSWFLHESLKCFHVIIGDSDSMTSSDCVHSLVASQLTDIRWACFVALHIHNDRVRRVAVKEIIARNAHKLKQNDDFKEWLTIELCLPSSYLSEGLAIESKSAFDYNGLARNLIDCQHWSEAHDVLMEWVWPQMVINEEYEAVEELIAKLKPNCQYISNWYSNGGHIFETYLRCLSRSNIEDIKEFNVHQLRCTTKTHVLCQSEMARKANIIFSELSGGQFAYNTPIPDDYALIELKHNAKHLIKSLC